jgi:predicted  nucleic acid-binding Zn-ribbon protein
VGKTGVGKSATANTISGGDYFESDATALAMTKTCKQQKVTRFGKDISIIDTPGIFDTETDQNVVLVEIKRCVYLGAPGLHAILYVMEIGRFRQEDLMVIQIFLKFFKQEMENRVIVVFTHGDKLLKKKQTLPDYLETVPGELKQFLEICENRVILFNNDLNKEQSNEQVSRILLMVEALKKANEDSAFYTDDAFEKAEERVEQREEEIMEMLEMEYKKKTEEYELLRKMLQDKLVELKKLREYYEEKLRNVREEVRKEIKSKKESGELIFHILSFISEHLKQNNTSNTTGATSGAENDYPSGACEFIPGF